MPPMLRRAAVASLVLVGVWLAAGWFGSHYALHPPWYLGVSPDGSLPVIDNVTWNGVDTDPLTEFGIPFEDVTLAAEDGQTLRGWFAAKPDAGTDAALLLVHGGGGDRRDYLRHVPIFYQAGWPVLLFDCREHGASDGEGRGISFGAREHRDVSSAVAWLREARGYSRVGVLGTSQGGGSVILAAARDPGIDAVIAENPFATLDALIWYGARELPDVLRWTLMKFVGWRTYAGDPQPIDVVDRIAPRPLLILHGTEDEVIEFEQSELLFARAGEPKSLWLAPGAKHTQVYDVHPEEYARRALAFFEPLRR